MSLTRLSLPTAEPLTLAQAKLHLRIDDTADDDIITALITVAREALEDRTNSTLISTAWRYKLNRFGSPQIRLPNGPILSVSSVTYLDTNNTLQTLSSDLWQLADGYLLPAYQQCWPSTICQPGAVTINYTAGYGTTAASVPAPLIQWIKLAIGDLYENRSASAERPALPQHFANALLTHAWSV